MQAGASILLFFLEIIFTYLQQQIPIKQNHEIDYIC